MVERLTDSQIVQDQAYTNEDVIKVLFIGLELDPQAREGRTPR